MKPLSALVAFNRSAEADDARRAAARQLVSAIERVYQQVGSHVEEIALLARTHGLDALLDELPAEVAALVPGVLSGIRASWDQMSDVPFPDVPVAAVPE